MGDCCCGCRAPRRLRFVPPAVVIAILLWLYGGFVRYAQPQLRHHQAPWLEIGCFHVMTFLVCASLGQTLLSKQSLAPRRRRQRLREQPQEGTGEQTQQTIDDKEDAPSRGTGGVETKANGARRFCRRCNIWKADRMHHCSSCRRCVLKMDHHCVYINKCIGYYNYKFFLQFLGWSAFTSLFEASLIFRYLLMAHLDHATALFFYGRLRFWSDSLQIVLVFFFSACLGIALLCFFAFHIFLTARNYTTLEFCEKRREPEYVNYFHLGILSNLTQVFGELNEAAYWFVPLPTPSVVQRGALSFPTNCKFDKSE